jgi:flagellar hook assembly protein FlgD
MVAAALLAVVWIAPRASGTAADWVHAQPVRLHTVGMPDGARLGVARSSGRAAAGPVTLDTGEQFSAAGVLCDVPSGGAVTIRLRTSADGTAWGPWTDLPVEVAGEGRSARAFTDPVWTGAARFVQIKAAGGAKGPAALTNVRVVAIDPSGGGSIVERLTGAARRVAAAVAGITFDPPALAASGAPVIVTRSQWGADERLRSASPSYSPVKMAFVHHTAGNNTYAQADAPALVRAIYAYHTKSLGWNDIGYNFLVDRFGTVYEGRYGGITRGVIGAHVYGFNTGSTGVSVMGTYTDAAPSAVALAALDRVLAWKLGVAGLDPAGTATLTCGATDKYKKGASVTFPVISGHRQANYTACPGDALSRLLPTVRTDVAARMGTTQSAALSANTLLISPNGDGVLDTLDFAVALSAPAGWTLAVTAAGGETVATWSGQETAATITWDGASGGGRVVDGTYSARLTTETGEVSDAIQVVVDTVAPKLEAASAAPPTFSPNGDRRDETVTATYTPSEDCSVRVGIQDAGGDVVRWLHGWRARKVKPYTVTWDGRITSGGSLVAAGDGQYKFTIERRDAGGTIARQGLKILLDRTLGFPAAAPTAFSPNGDGALDSTRLGFRLARKASVTIRVLVGDEVVRTLSLGTLAAGKHTAAWDGKAGPGEALTSCRPRFIVTATSSLGESSVSRGLVVDVTRPRVFASPRKTTSRGVSTRLGFKVTDAFSARAGVTWKVTNAKGRRVASGRRARVVTGRGLTVGWRPTSRGVFTVTFRATDLAGNRQVKPARTVVKVR